MTHEISSPRGLVLKSPETLRKDLPRFSQSFTGLVFSQLLRERKNSHVKHVRMPNVTSRTITLFQQIQRDTGRRRGWGGGRGEGRAFTFD